jgi:hypothetical protein
MKKEQAIEEQLFKDVKDQMKKIDPMKQLQIQAAARAAEELCKNKTRK